MGHSRRSTFAIAAALAAVAAMGAPAPAHAQKTLRAVMHSDLKILDPIWTTAYIVRNHGYMVYDTLFAMDEKGEIKPQMVDKHEVSADKLTYTFTLRDGLVWHDGQPVTAEDCVASIKRWAAKDAMGQKLMTFVDGIERQGRQDLRHEAQGADRPRAAGARQALLERALHDAQARRRDRSQHADLRLHRLGPFVFKQDEWKPGDKTVYVKYRQVQAARRSRPPASPAARSSRSTASNGAPSPTTSRRSTRCSPARSTSSRRRRTTCCRCSRPTPTSSLSTGTRSATSTRSAPTGCTSRSTTQGAPGAVVRLQPGGLPEGGDRRSRSTTRCASRCSPAARRSPARRAWTGC